jgi:hypothetical protein
MRVHGAERDLSLRPDDRKKNLEDLRELDILAIANM